MRTLASLAAIGVGVYAVSMDRRTRKSWKKRLEPFSFSTIENLMPKRRTRKRLRNQMLRAFS